MSSRPLEKEEIESVEKEENALVPGLPLKRSVIVDISGGGIRFVGDYAYEPDSLVYCKYNLVVDGKSKEYVLVAKILIRLTGKELYVLFLKKKENTEKKKKDYEMITMHS